MPTLHVRNVPRRTYARIKKLAAGQRRSLSAEVLSLLERATQEEETLNRQARLLRHMREHLWIPPSGTPSAVELLREDRKR